MIRLIFDSVALGAALLSALVFMLAHLPVWVGFEMLWSMFMVWRIIDRYEDIRSGKVKP